MPTVYHMVHYRRFDPGSAGLQGGTLEGLCRSALGHVDASGVTLWERIQDRFHDLADVAERQVLLNRVVDLSDAVFGEMCLFQKKDFQALLEMQASKVQLSNITTAEIYNLAERAAPNNAKFIRGLCYWLVIGNHMFFIKTQSMTAQILNSYMDWLLKSRTSALSANATFALQAEFDRTQVVGDIGDITRLKVSGKSASPITVMAGDEKRPEKSVSTSRTVTDRAFYTETARKVAEIIFGRERTNALVDSLGPNEFLAVEAAVKVRGKRTVESREKLRQLAEDLADLTDDKVQIEGKDGKLSDEDAILRTRMPFNQPLPGSSILEFDNVATQLQLVYSRFVQDGKIES